jgi:hypothetical protein
LGLLFADASWGIWEDTALGKQVRIVILFVIVGLLAKKLRYIACFFRFLLLLNRLFDGILPHLKLIEKLAVS